MYVLATCLCVQSLSQKLVLFRIIWRSDGEVAERRKGMRKEEERKVTVKNGNEIL